MKSMLQGKRPVICPKCKSEKTAPILYGLPADEMLEASKRGEIIFGGCAVTDDMPQPDYGCTECGFRWSDELLPATHITKIRYKVVENGPCPLEFMRTWVYEIKQDGSCTKYQYQGRGGRYQFREIKKVSGRRVYRLARSLQKIIGAPLWESNIIDGRVCDGFRYNLQISHTDNRKLILEGDVSGGTFDSILDRFVRNVFD